MKKFTKCIIALSCTIALGLSQQSFAEDIPNPFANMQNQKAATQAPSASPFEQNNDIVIPEPPVFDAESWVLMDYTTGQVLFQRDGNKKIWPASLTKMMTSYVIGMEIKAGRLNLSDMVTITEDAWAKNYTDSSKMFIEVGKQISVDQLNKGIIIQSGNDACVAMAIHLAGSEQGFVSVMNRYAKQLGLKSTHFANVHGLFSEQNYSTAYDMALLGRALIRDLPDEYAVYAQKEFTFNGIRQTNRNRLLWDKELSVDGIKTGHLSQIGYNLVASAYEGNMRLIASVIGAKSESQRANFSKQMLNYGFRFYEHHTPFKQDQTILVRDVVLGDKDKVELTVPNTVTITLPKGKKDDLKVSYRLSSAKFTAPISKSQNLGVLEIKLYNNVIARYPLVAKNAIAEGGFISRMTDKIMMFFSSEG